MNDRFPINRRNFVKGAAALAAFNALTESSKAAELFTNDFIAEQTRRNFINSKYKRSLSIKNTYQKPKGRILHIFGYGQSLSQGWYGFPVLSTTQPFDNLMIGNATRAAENATKPTITTSWLPTGNPGANGIYPFNPMIATLERTGANITETAGETPGEGALNYFRSKTLKASPNSQMLFTNCGLGGRTIAELLPNPDPTLNIFNRLVEAATYGKQTADSLGYDYQIVAMLWTQGEQDVAYGTSYADYLSGLQQMQQAFLTQVVQGIAGQDPSVTIPWFSHQPNSSGVGKTLDVYQAGLDWSNTPGSDFYIAGPVYPYPSHNVHLTANSYRWYANQVGKAMATVFATNTNPAPMQMLSAMFNGTTAIINLDLPVAPLISNATAYGYYQQLVYPNIGFLINDSAGVVPITSATPLSDSIIQLTFARTLQNNPIVQYGNNTTGADIDWGGNLCDSDSTVALNSYVYNDGIQDPGEDIASWNGKPLIGNPYPLNNYMAVSRLPMIAASFR
jgi:hypothetical protein